MKKSLRDISRFSAKAACRYRLLWIAIVFIVIVVLAVGSALIQAFDESAPLPTYGFEFSLDGSTAPASVTSSGGDSRTSVSIRCSDHGHSANAKTYSPTLSKSKDKQ